MSRKVNQQELGRLNNQFKVVLDIDMLDVLELARITLQHHFFENVIAMDMSEEDAATLLEQLKDIVPPEESDGG